DGAAAVAQPVPALERAGDTGGEQHQQRDLRVKAGVRERRGTLREEAALQGEAHVLIGDLVDGGVPVIDPALAQGGQHRFRVLLQETQRRDEGGGSSHSGLPFARLPLLSSYSLLKPRSLPPWHPGQHLSDLQILSGRSDRSN